MTTELDGDNDTSRVALRRTRAAEMRLAHKTWKEIADELGYASGGAAYSALMPHIRKQAEETIAELRDLTNARLERVMAVLLPLAEAGNIPAAHQYRRYLADFRRHNGLDAPVQIQVSTGAAARLDDVLADATKVVLGLVEATDDGVHEITDLPPALEA